AGEPIAQPEIEALIEPGHGYSRIALSRQVIGHEKELLRYYSSALEQCKRYGLHPKKDRDCRACFSILSIILWDGERFSIPSDLSLNSNLQIMNLLLRKGDGVLFEAIDQTGEMQLLALGGEIYLFHRHEETEKINIHFSQDSFQCRVQSAKDRLENLMQRFRREIGDDYWDFAR